MKWPINWRRKAVPAAPGEPGFFVPKDTVIHGSMEVPLPCRIEGAIDGDVQVKGSLVISAAAAVSGNVRCDDIIVYGKVGGHISCTQKALIAAGAYVDGTIDAAVLEIEEQATVMYNQVAEPEPVFFDTSISIVIAPPRSTVNENTWF